MIWLWDICPTGEVPVAWRVQSAHIYQIGSVPGVDDNGELVIMPVYSAWAETLVQEGPEMVADVPCEPAAGEVCAMRVTSLDEAGNVDLGEDCS